MEETTQCGYCIDGETTEIIADGLCPSCNDYVVKFTGCSCGEMLIEGIHPHSETCNRGGLYIINPPICIEHKLKREVSNG